MTIHDNSNWDVYEDIGIGEPQSKNFGTCTHHRRHGDKADIRESCAKRRTYRECTREKIGSNKKCRISSDTPVETLTDRTLANCHDLCETRHTTCFMFSHD